MPCSNCRRGQIPCIFPAPGRAPRRVRPKDPNAPAKQPSSERELELMKRLRKLEGIVEELSGQIEVESVRHPYSAGNSPEAGAAYQKDEHILGGRLVPGPNVTSAGGGGSAGSVNHESPGFVNARLQTRPTSASISETDSIGKASPDVHKQFGRLVLNEKGVTRYVSSSLWSSINDEVSQFSFTGPAAPELTCCSWMNCARRRNISPTRNPSSPTWKPAQNRSATIRA